MSPDRWISPTLIVSLFAAIGQANAQSTQGLITGKVTDTQTRRPVAQAAVKYWRTSADGSSGVIASGSTQTGSDGLYALPFLTPGTYRLRAQSDGYQAHEINELQLFVAGRLEFNFSLRPLSDVWELEAENAVVLHDTSALVHFYAADVENLRSARVQLTPPQPSSTQPTLSYVVDSTSMENLPLAGRDIYTTLVMQPGVTADNATARGLGVAINGQRPSSSNFLLDGVENNNYLITGPLSAISPEGMQEYRVSVNNFSAEYGNTVGFVANAITRSGGGDHHGLVYGYLGNDTFDANDFQRNRLGLGRTPRTELHAGFRVGGPILRSKLFYSGAFERFHSRSRLGQDLTKVTSPENELFTVCVPAPLDKFRAFPGAPKNTVGLWLLERFPSPATPTAGSSCADLDDLTVPYSYFEPVSINRNLGLVRLDFQPQDEDRFMARLVFARGSRPDFIFSPYKEFNSELHDDSTGVALSYIRSFGPRATNELKFGWRNTDLGWDHPHPWVPTLRLSGVSLPGSPAFYEFNYRDSNWEVSDSLVLHQSRHLVTVGAGLLLRRPESLLSFGRDGEYSFDGLADFAADAPSRLRISVDRRCGRGNTRDSERKCVESLPFKQSPFDRRYANTRISFLAVLERIR